MSEGRIDVGLDATGEPTDRRTTHLGRDALHGSQIAGGRRGEPCLDHVDAQTRQLLGDLDLFLDVQRCARRLLAIAQRGVKDNHSIHHWVASWFRT